MPAPTQLSLAISLNDDATFENFLAVQESQALVMSVLKSIAERQDSGSLLLWGGSGSGLSHLLQALCHAHAESSFSRAQGSFAQYLPLAELVSYPAVDVCDGLDQAEIVCLDDFDVIAGKRDWELALFHLFNRLKDQNRSMVVSSHTSPTGLALGLADLKSRIQGAATYHLAELTDESKAAALIMRAKLRGLEMSEEVAAFILRRVARNSGSLFHLLDILDERSLQQQRKLTIPFIKSVLQVN